MSLTRLGQGGWGAVLYTWVTVAVARDKAPFPTAASSSSVCGPVAKLCPRALMQSVWWPRWTAGYGLVLNVFPGLNDSLTHTATKLSLEHTVT